MSVADEALGAGPRVKGGTFFGEPRALAYLAFTEAWERFSFYGMTALLVLYMTEALFTPGRIGHIADFATFRAGLESIFGPMSTVALASQVYGLYTGFVYFTPIFGGLIADRLIGRRNAVMLGAILMSAGHIAMAFDVSFLLALLLLIVGCGFLKGNISTQVGTLYAENDGAGRTRGFSIFSVGINVGAVAGPLACGLLAQVYGWHMGFGLAGVLMLIGLATYTLGYRHLQETVAKHATVVADAPLTRRDYVVVGAIFVTVALTIFHSIAYYQNSNICLIWIQKYVNLGFLGFTVPVSWFNSIDSFVSIISVPALFALWRWQASRGSEPTEIGKMGQGAWMAAAANLLLAICCVLFKHVSALAPIVYDVILGVAFLYYWPTLLALVSRAAPQKLKATLMGGVFLSLFVSNLTMGWLGGFYEHMGPAAFWAMNAAIAATGGILIYLLRPWLERLLNRPQGEMR